MKNPRKISWNVWQVVLLVAVIFLFRILYVDLYRGLQDSYGYNLYHYIFLFVSDIFSITLTVAFNLLFVWWAGKKYPPGKSPVRRLVIQVAYLLAISLVMTFVSNRKHIWEADGSLNTSHLLLSFLAIILVNAFFVVMADIALYFRKSKLELDAEKNKKRKAQYQYRQLKQQLNPHFLFNSLNILDYLVQNGDTQRASEFIRKLASVYRYLLREAENQLVTLKEELDFTNMYIDLLKERFTEGLVVETDVPKSCYKHNIVPCGLQLLVENATKHNVVDAGNILRIRIYCEGEKVIVTNNIQPRINESDSTGLGLASIRKQYQDIANAEIEIINNGKEFTVVLPLL